MSVGTYALTTLADEQNFLDLGTLSAADTSLVEGLIDGASRDIEDLLGTYLIQRSGITEDHLAGVGGRRGGAKRIFLKHFPIASVTSIVDDAGATVSSTDYTIVAAEGYLEHVNYWPAPEYRWTVTYVAGEYANTAAVDKKYKAACWMLVADRFVRRTPEAQSSDGGVKVQFGPNGIPAPVQDMLRSSGHRTINV